MRVNGRECNLDGFIKQQKSGYIPQQQEPALCARCHAQLRATNIDPFTDETGRPVCDPCHHVIEREANETT